MYTYVFLQCLCLCIIRFIELCAKITVHANKQHYSFLVNSPYGMNKELFNELKCSAPVFGNTFFIVYKYKNKPQCKINHDCNNHVGS